MRRSSEACGARERRPLSRSTIALVCSALFVSACGVGPADVPPCAPSFRGGGKDGVVDFQQSGPGQPIAWGVRANDDAFNQNGQWTVDVYSGRRRVDGKTQNYPPHGSVNARDVRPGELLVVEGQVTLTEVGPRNGEVGFFRGTCRQT